MSFSDYATWGGILIKDLTREDLLEALYRKHVELQWCYLEMNGEQTKRVAAKIMEKNW